MEKTRSFICAWPIWALLIGGSLLYEFWPIYQSSRALAGDRAALTMGKVDATQAYRKAGKAPTYEVGYSFQVSGTTHRGHHSCQCEELSIVQKDDPIQIRYVRANPEQSLPTLVRYNSTWLAFGIGAGFVLMALGAVASGHRFLRRGTA
jgi:hypothetical protein